MGMMRQYCVLRKEVADHFGYPQYVTFRGAKGQTYHRDHMRVIQLSDYVIECDDDGVRYIKNRDYPHSLAVVDPNEMVWIKLCSVELENNLVT